MVSTLKFKIFLKFFLREANFLEDSHWVIKFQKKRSVRFVEHINQHRMGYLPKMVSTLKFKIFLISNSWNQELEANWNFLEDKNFKKNCPALSVAEAVTVMNIFLAGKMVGYSDCVAVDLPIFSSILQMLWKSGRSRSSSSWISRYK